MAGGLLAVLTLGAAGPAQAGAVYDVDQLEVTHGFEVDIAPRCGSTDDAAEWVRVDAHESVRVGRHIDTSGQAWRAEIQTALTVGFTELDTGDALLARGRYSDRVDYLDGTTVRSGAFYNTQLEIVDDAPDKTVDPPPVTLSVTVDAGRLEFDGPDVSFESFFDLLDVEGLCDAFEDDGGPQQPPGNTASADSQSHDEST